MGGIKSAVNDWQRTIMVEVVRFRPLTARLWLIGSMNLCIEPAVCSLNRLGEMIKLFMGIFMGIFMGKFMGKLLMTNVDDKCWHECLA